MAEKKKMSVADILAAARKSDAKGSEAAPPSEAAPTEAAPPEAISTEAAPPIAASGEAAPIEKPAKPAPKPAAKPGGARMSVAEMMAAARAEKAAGGAAPAAKPAAAKPAPAPKADKPAAKPAAAKVEATPAAPKETASILAAARTTAKPGPMTKAEADAKGDPAAKPAKPKAYVPPMPAKPEYAKPKAKASVPEEDRRGFLGFILGSFLAIGFTSLAVATGLWTLGTARFMFPNILTEPPSRFKVGFPANFAPGQVETKFVAQYGVWIVNYEYQGQPEIYALKTVCTHLGCTPNWLEGEQKFKCPCHGSGFYKDGINFEGPAPRPLERYSIRIGDDGQLEVDKSKTFQEEMGQWSDPSSFVVV